MDESKFIGQFDVAKENLKNYFDQGASISKQIKRVYFIGCGAPNRLMQALQFWIENLSASLEVRTYFPADFIAINPPRLDHETLVILASKSGSTKEVVDAAKFLQGKTCKTLAVTQSGDSLLAQNVKQCLYFGKADDAYFSCYMTMQAYTAGILAERHEFDEVEALINELGNLPKYLLKASVQTDEKAKAVAKKLANEPCIYHISSGPAFTSAYVLGVCILSESQWSHNIPIEAAEFFHGPFESFDKSTPFILYMGDDVTRSQVERVKTFAERYLANYYIFDSRDYPYISDSSPLTKAMIMPYVLGYAAERVATHISEMNHQPLSSRKYMWKVEY